MTLYLSNFLLSLLKLYTTSKGGIIFVGKMLEKLKFFIKNPWELYFSFLNKNKLWDLLLVISFFVKSFGLKNFYGGLFYISPVIVFTYGPIRGINFNSTYLESRSILSI